jgi:hypothetical protein
MSLYLRRPSRLFLPPVSSVCWAFAGNMVSVFPDIVDGIDADEALREYSDILGTSPDVIISSDDLAAKRQARADAAQVHQQACWRQGPKMAQSAKVLSETDTQNPNALTNLLGGLGAPTQGTAV